MVIGILAVLAAIAIPSVAGLIDRANVSADDTNANEMTNAIERFTSEYELVCQDIASGRFNINDLDGAQSRVYNATGIDERKDIELIEKANVGLNGISLNKDTKYPENEKTFKAIIENYTKTSSATFEPKQSDKAFYYSPDCGVVVVDEKTTAITEEVVLSLNANILSGKDAKGQTLDENTSWILISDEEPASRGNFIYYGEPYVCVVDDNYIITVIFYSDGSVKEVHTEDGTIVFDTEYPAGDYICTEGQIDCNGDISQIINDGDAILTIDGAIFYRQK